MVALAAGDPDPADNTATARLESPASPLGVLAIAPAACTVCGACATVCPTGALWMTESELGTTLGHDPAECVGCARCVAACPEDALTVIAAIDVARLRDVAVTLVAAPREHCAGCSTVLAPGPMRRRLATLLGGPPDPDDLCPACARRAGAPMAPG